MNPIARLGFVAIGYVVACALAGLIFSVLWAMDEYGPAGEIAARILPRAAVFGGFAAAAALPAILAIAYAEYAAERRYLFYAVIGALAGLLPAVMAMPSLSRLLSPEGGLGLALFAVTGLVGGTAYWLIAGRRAGLSAPAD